ncbi:MAG: hypothetical protein HGB04_03900 [Chlorobiaceae bacterium]|nr:hypothetical protein [Chlorobiaceae bacterium]
MSAESMTLVQQHPQSGALMSFAQTSLQIKEQVNLIKSVMKDVMKDGEHYGKIPGCGDKPALLKPGAETIMSTFRLANDLDVDVIDMPGGHREYRMKCTLFSPNGQRLGTGVGSCSTLEGKYRYRTGAGEVTELAVPKAYWDKKREDPAAAAKILRETANQAGIEGDKFSTKKDDTGVWRIATFADKIEHDNPADYYNTCMKMASKRAQVAAVLTTTAASDIFTQDIDDDPDLYGGGRHKKPAPEPNGSGFSNHQQPADKKPANNKPKQDANKPPSIDWASQEQLAKLVDLSGHPALPDDKREAIENWIRGGRIASKDAADMIGKLETMIDALEAAVLA